MKLRLPKTRRYRVYLYILSILIILFAIDLAWVRIDRRITLSKETTYITSPLKPDGSPDYVQAIDDIYSAGVTDENNAAPLLLSAFDPETLPASYREQIYARLHMPLHPQPLNYRDVYSVRIDAKGNRNYDEKAADELYDCGRTLWKAADHPALAQWLQSAAPSFDLLHRATQRPRYYVPYRTLLNDPLLTSDPIFPDLGDYRQLAYATCARAMLRATVGKFEEARADLLAVHRLARLVGQGQFIIERLVAVAIDRAATDGDITLATSGILTPAQARQLLADLQSLPPLPTIAEALFTVRYTVLDALAYASRHGIAAAVLAYRTDPDALSLDDKFAINAWNYTPVSINAAMRETNAFYDQMTGAFSATPYARKVTLAGAIAHDLDHFSDQPALVRSLHPTKNLVALFIPSLGLAEAIYVVQQMQLDLARLALALAAYHADHHAYPKALADLAPAYLPAIPMDVFSDEPLHYALTSTGYRLYSIGRNMKDDDGQTARDHDAGHLRADDLVVTVP